MENNELKMPVFDYSAPLTISAEDLEKEGTKTKGGKFLTPGTYTARISEVNYKGLSDSDNAWAKFSISLIASNDKSARTFLMVPVTSKLTFGAKASTYPSLKVRNILAAAGIKVSNDAEFKAGLQAAFADPSKSKLLNREVSITVGYSAPYIAFTGKDAVVLKNADGSLHASYADRVWGSKDELLAEVRDAGIKVEDFPEILKIESAKRATKTDASGF